MFERSIVCSEEVVVDSFTIDQNDYGLNYNLSADSSFEEDDDYISTFVTGYRAAEDLENHKQEINKKDKDKE